MEFCISDINRTYTGDDASRGLYPAPDRSSAFAFADDDADGDAESDADAGSDSGSGSAFDFDSEFAGTPGSAPNAITPISATTGSDVAGTSSGGSDSGAPASSLEDGVDAPTLTVAVIEPNADIAEGLQQLMQTLPGVARVTTMTSSADLLRRLTSDVDVSAFSLSASMPDVTVPEFIFLDTGKACGTSARSNQNLRASIEELQRTLPTTALVLMSVYPDRLQSDLRDMVTACIRKDTSRQELEALITRVRASRGAGFSDPTRA